MATLWFVPPVFVKSETNGVRHGCNNARAALKQLKRWTRRGPCWHKAWTLCLGMKQLLSEMAALADPGFWVALAVVLIPYAIGVALLVWVAG
ncbi:MULTISPECIES: hypothetical protein [unclassified Mesorhizobium]|uniref:hypothetical protein n=1 Tax=unclassified Mesorhizobium TaxID=325217 RepID=UPI000484B572|nr:MULTISPECIES: hypothetical protein [unclassified Mesorhizobium]RWB99646.1 MAG: hypothetical protein EOQ56_18395 [Mesorhizobium sp.]RWO05212.1 MAG: hypothetical protein EOS08_33025 [Mesorhizobium sp.]RWO96377.1 MAG: hypothetical protein EOQ99_33105 [Mesorhizobium sp.]RWP17857.1 MAG: hypothetical protein EOR01_24195 [Mesorhizobium sp.]RWP22693.1 MAG: hypothetical protein EOR02_33585 [Mesorhizobium sp.]